MMSPIGLWTTILGPSVYPCTHQHIVFMMPEVTIFGNRSSKLAAINKKLG